MLELPESYTIARQINEHLTGKIISHIETRRHRTNSLSLMEQWISMRNIWRGRSSPGQPFRAEWYKSTQRTA